MTSLLNKKIRLSLLLVSVIAVAFTLWLRQIAPAREVKEPPSRHALESMPDTILWAWERPEDLRFIDTQDLGVAYLAKTIRLRAGTINVRPRVQPLRIPRETSVIAVIRIETERQLARDLTSIQLAATANEIAGVGKLPNVVAIQIDFDAKASERRFYRDLLMKIRRDLQPSIALSITALASWCAGDNWISDLPVDEVVPMFFRLGVDRNRFTSRLLSGTGSLSANCSEAAGVSTDEVIAPPQHKRIYIFSPQPWTPASVNTARETYRR